LYKIYEDGKEEEEEEEGQKAKGRLIVII